MNVPPRSTDAFRISNAWSSGICPQSADPSCQQPRPISETGVPRRAAVRYFMRSSVKKGHGSTGEARRHEEHEDGVHKHFGETGTVSGKGTLAPRKGRS